MRQRPSPVNEASSENNVVRGQNYHTSLYTDTFNADLSVPHIRVPITENVHFNDVAQYCPAQMTHAGYYGGGGSFQGFENDLLRTISSSTDGSERILIKNDPIRASSRSNRMKMNQRASRRDFKSNYNSLRSNSGHMRDNPQSASSSKSNIYGSLNSQRLGGISNPSFQSSSYQSASSATNSYDSQSMVLSSRSTMSSNIRNQNLRNHVN